MAPPVKATPLACYRRNVRREGGSSCWPSEPLGRREVRLLVETMGGPSWQTVALCDKHRREAAAEGRVRAA